MATEGKKLVRSKSGLKIVAVSDEHSSPFLMCEPIWIPDKQCKECLKCRNKFDFLNRRHHCRRCGQCYCSGCCDNKLPLPRMSFIDPVRQCGDCAQVTLKENDFFEKHIRTLTNGACFNVQNVVEENANITMLCRLSSDHRCIKFESESQLSQDDIDLSQIDSAQILTAGTNPQGNAMASGLSLSYQDSCGDRHSIKLFTSDSVNRKQSIMWIVAMQKALKLIYEARGNTSPGPFGQSLTQSGTVNK